MVLVGFPRRSVCSAKCLLVQATNLALALLAVTIFWIIVNGDKEAAHNIARQRMPASSRGVQQQLEVDLEARKQQLQEEMCRVRKQQQAQNLQQQHVHVDTSGKVTINKASDTATGSHSRKPCKGKKQEAGAESSKKKKKAKRTKQAKLSS